MRRVYICTVLMAACLCLSNVQADMYDLTGVPAGSNNSAAINGALFYNVNAASTGSGVIHSFVRIDGANNSSEQGYNTDGRPLYYDENNSPTFTRSLSLSLVPIVNIDGTNYREFLLDINQNKTGPGRLLSLDLLTIYQAGVGDLTGPRSGLGAPIFDLGNDVTGGPNWILLDYALNHGSGSGDMFAYIPSSLFSADYVYLYSMFGDHAPYRNTGGFEEWAVRKDVTPPPPPPVPAPAAVLLGMLGLSAAGCGLRRFA